MAVTVDDLRTIADQLLDALDVYGRFREEWPYEHGTVPDDVEEFLTGVEWKERRSNMPPSVAVVTVVKNRYYEARQSQATYVEQAREQGRSDWSNIVAETAPVREATGRVHAAGYEAQSDVDEPEYLLPRELCPAHLVSMNNGSSPVTFADRVAQYRAVADCFDLSPDIVYHPGSGHDVSPSEAFPESRVIYLDVDVAAMADLRRAGYEAVGTDAAAYELRNDADLIVFRNAGLLEEPIVETNLHQSGWVLANNHLESAEHLAELGSLELKGVVPDCWTGDTPTVDTTDLGAYLTRSESAGEARSPPPFRKGSSLDLYVFRHTA